MKFQTARMAPHAWGFDATVDLDQIAPGLYVEPKSGIRIQREEAGRWVVIDPKLREAALGVDAAPASLDDSIRSVRTVQAKREEYLVGRGSRLATAACYLTRYLNDRAAGTLGARKHYGFHGDARPIPR